MSLSSDDFMENSYSARRAMASYLHGDWEYEDRPKIVSASPARVLGSRAANAYLAMAYITETGSAWYQANSDTVSMPNARCDGASNRWETNVGSTWNDVGYEVVGYLKPTAGTMEKGDDGGHIGLKHGGPNHTPPCDYQIKNSDGDYKCCCWWDGGVRQTGKTYLEIERPHPHNYNRTYGTSIGRTIDNGSMLGVRWSLRKTGNYHERRLRLWVDTSGGINYKWRKMYDYIDSGQKMPSSYAITSHQNIEIRVSDIPCSRVNWQWGPKCRRMSS